MSMARLQFSRPRVGQLRVRNMHQCNNYDFHKTVTGKYVNIEEAREKVLLLALKTKRVIHRKYSC